MTEFRACSEHNLRD